MKFFDAIYEAVENAKVLEETDEEAWETFKKEFKTNIMNAKSGIELIEYSSKGSEVFNKITRILQRVANKYASLRENYSKSSLAGSLNYLFKGPLIGEKSGITRAINQVLGAAGNKMVEIMEENSNLSGRPIGSNVSGSTKKFQKADYEITGATMKYRASIDGTAENPVILQELVGSLKQLDNFNLNTQNYGHITIEHKGSLYNLMLQEGYSAYAAANIITHSNKQTPKFFSQQLHSFYQFLLRNYLVDFLAGREGEKTVLMLDVNGYKYPIFSIIKEYINTMKIDGKFDQYNKNNLIYIKTSIPDNKKEGSQQNNIQDALERSNAVLKIINKITVEIKMNSHKLAELIKNLPGLKPLT